MTKATILAVDDDPLVLAYLEVLLVREGFEFVAAPGPAEALGVIDRQPPDLLIVDIAMPGANGLEFCEQLRARRELESLPIIIHTGSTEVKKYSDSDLYDFAFQKGTDPKVLLHAIRAFLPEPRED
jgi:CheY-like chemotaxis protein